MNDPCMIDAHLLVVQTCFSIKEVTLNIHMIDDIKKLIEDPNKGLSELSSAIETVRQDTEDDIMEIKEEQLEAKLVQLRDRLKRSEKQIYQ